MNANDELISRLLATVTRPLPLDEFSESLKGSVLQIRVNAPKVIEQLRDETEQAQDKLPGRRRAVALLLEQPLERIDAMDDVLMSWIFMKGMALYNQYHEELLKKASAA